MNSRIAALLHKLRILSDLPGKLPGNVYVEAATLGTDIGEMAAEHQMTTGFLGQSGSFGGAPWQPDSVDREIVYIRTGRIF